MLEVMPPFRRATQEKILEAAKAIKVLVDSLGGVDYINIPEIVEENYAGVPLYKHIDVCDFGVALQRETDARVVVNKISVHFGSEAKFRSWLDYAVKSQRIRNFIFVGGINSTNRYPGPQVLRADALASSIKGVGVGNICIPSRKGELDRLVAKTKAGCSFFTTQILFDVEPLKGLLVDYNTKCKSEKLTPATFFLSFAPVVSRYDLDFIKWLGAEVPDNFDSIFDVKLDPFTVSEATISSLFSDVESFVKKEKLKIKLAINVEAISGSNLAAAGRLIGHMRENKII